MFEILLHVQYVDVCSPLQLVVFPMFARGSPCAVTKIQEHRIHFVLHYTCRNAPEDTAIRISVKQYVVRIGARAIRASVA